MTDIDTIRARWAAVQVGDWTRWTAADLARVCRQSTVTLTAVLHAPDDVRTLLHEVRALQRITETVTAAGAALHQIAETVIDVHAEVDMDTPEDRELHRRAVETFREAISTTGMEKAARTLLHETRVLREQRAWATDHVTVWRANAEQAYRHVDALTVERDDARALACDLVSQQPGPADDARWAELEGAP